LNTLGRLQFIGGGWVQNDEATSHYYAIVDQMSYGLRKLLDTFGEENLPVTAWQIDPFGHSRGVADLFRRVSEHVYNVCNHTLQMGYTSLHFARLHWQDHDLRLKQNRECMNWQTDPNKGYK
jgi:lysosomal alpha-mannosidase